MRKLLALLLVFGLLVGVVACAGTTTPQTTAPATDPAKTDAPETCLLYTSRRPTRGNFSLVPPYHGNEEPSDHEPTVRSESKAREFPPATSQTVDSTHVPSPLK